MNSNKTIFSNLIFIIAICNLLSDLEAFKLIKNAINNMENSTNNLKNSEFLNMNLVRNKSGLELYGTEKYYNFGNRITGDQRIGELKENYKFPAATDKEIILSFPKNKEKKLTITLIRIYVDQSTINGSANIVDGGIEENFIEIMVKAEQTMWFSYLAECYGY